MSRLAPSLNDGIYDPLNLFEGEITPIAVDGSSTDLKEPIPETSFLMDYFL